MQLRSLASIDLRWFIDCNYLQTSKNFFLNVWQPQFHRCSFPTALDLSARSALVFYILLTDLISENHHLLQKSRSMLTARDFFPPFSIYHYILPRRGLPHAAPLCPWAEAALLPHHMRRKHKPNATLQLQWLRTSLRQSVEQVWYKFAQGPLKIKTWCLRSFVCAAPAIWHKDHHWSLWVDYTTQSDRGAGHSSLSRRQTCDIMYENHIYLFFNISTLNIQANAKATLW